MILLKLLSVAAGISLCSLMNLLLGHLYICSRLLSVFTSDNHGKQSVLLRMIIGIFITTVLHYISWKVIQTLDIIREGFLFPC